MTRINLDNKFLVFLYAYLRQMDLSLDRTRWVTWEDLKQYYNSQGKPSEIVDKIVKLSGVNDIMLPVVFNPKELSFIQRLTEFFLRVIKSQSLSEIEIKFCCQLLHKFNYLLHCDFEDYPLDAERLRIDVAKFYSYVIAPKLARRDVHRAMRVEHFMENKHLDIVKINEFLNDSRL